MLNVNNCLWLYICELLVPCIESLNGEAIRSPDEWHVHHTYNCCSDENLVSQLSIIHFVLSLPWVFAIVQWHFFLLRFLFLRLHKRIWVYQMTTGLENIGGTELGIESAVLVWQIETGRLNCDALLNRLAEFNTSAVACSRLDDCLFLVFCGGTEIGLTREVPVSCHFCPHLWSGVEQGKESIRSGTGSHGQYVETLDICGHHRHCGGKVNELYAPM